MITISLYDSNFYLRTYEVNFWGKKGSTFLALRTRTFGKGEKNHGYVGFEPTNIDAYGLQLFF